MYYEFNSSSGSNGSGNNNSGKDSAQWTMIILLALFGLWPIAAILAFYKVRNDRVAKYTAAQKTPPPLYTEVKTAQAQQAPASHSKKGKKFSEVFREFMKDDDNRAAVCLVAGALLAVGGVFAIASALPMLFYGELVASEIVELIQGILILIAGGGIIGSGLRTKRAISRYAQYVAIIGAQQAVNIKELAKTSGYSEKTVNRDLQKMTEKGMFGETAYINAELGYLFLSSKADEELRARRNEALHKAVQASQKVSAAEGPDVYESTLKRIRDLNDRIANPYVSEKIDRLEAVTSEIFKVVQKEPSKVPKIDRFMSYYIPSTLKLLETYENLEGMTVEGENISKGKASIENAMDGIVKGFEHQLDNLYKMDTMSIETDIEVMEKMMGQDAPGKSDFHTSQTAQQTSGGSVSLGGTAAQTK